MDGTARTALFDDCWSGGSEPEPANSSCICPDPADDWVINMTEGCEINDTCDITGYDISFTGTGSTYINATIDCDNINAPGAGMILYVRDSAEIYLHG